MVRISRTAGMRRRITGSAVNSAAASAGRAEFLEPLAGIEPVRGRPPLMTNLSMLFRFFQCRRDTAAGGVEHLLG